MIASEALMGATTVDAGPANNGNPLFVDQWNEAHPANTPTVLASAPPVSFQPPSVGSAIGSVAQAFPMPTPLRLAIDASGNSSLVVTPPMTSGFTPTPMPDNIGSSALSPTIFSAPSEVSSGGAGFPGPLIPTPTDTGVTNGGTMQLSPMATSQSSSANGSTAQSTVSGFHLSKDGWLIVGALVGLMLLK